MVNHDAPLSIRPLRAVDIPQVGALICNTLLLTNLRDYDLETIQALMPILSTEAVGALARRREMFVCEEAGRLSGVLGLVSASLTAVGFYERLGYRRMGAENDSRSGRTVDLIKRL